MSDKKSEKDLLTQKPLGANAGNLDKLDINDPMVRLMQENAKHRECIENLKTLLRCNFTKDTEGLKLESAVALVIKEHDKALDLIAQLKTQVTEIKKLLTNNQNKDALELCGKILKNKI